MHLFSRSLSAVLKRVVAGMYRTLVRENSETTINSPVSHSHVAFRVPELHQSHYRGKKMKIPNSHSQGAKILGFYCNFLSRERQKARYPANHVGLQLE